MSILAHVRIARVRLQLAARRFLTCMGEDLESGPKVGCSTSATVTTGTAAGSSERHIESTVDARRSDTDSARRSSTSRR